MEEYVINELVNSKVFSEDELRFINNNIDLVSKIYQMGMIDGTNNVLYKQVCTVGAPEPKE